MSTLVLGGPYNGHSGKQTVNVKRDSENASTRRILRDSWNGEQASGTVNNNKRIITPFRATTNLGDFLSRQNYVCGGSNQVQRKNGGTMIMTCDSTGVPGFSGNSKFVADSSDYARFKKQRAMNINYNDEAH
tara:strand:+ start:6707 stop:7102 length:396 start_codon:yes stop_codon:yes gene_type:complete